MATEKNPFDKIREEITNVVQMPTPEQMLEGAPTFEMEEDGGVTVDFTGVVEMEAEEEIQEWYGDLTDKLEDEEKENIASDVVDNYTSDKESRAEWEAMFEKGFDLLGLKIQESSEPFEGACTAVHPMLIESAVKFQSKAIQELFPPSGPVKTQILGKSTPEREDQANRVQEFMNYQVMHVMEDFDPDLDQRILYVFLHLGASLLCTIIGLIIGALYHVAIIQRLGADPFTFGFFITLTIVVLVALIILISIWPNRWFLWTTQSLFFIALFGLLLPLLASL